MFSFFFSKQDLGFLIPLTTGKPVITKGVNSDIGGLMQAQKQFLQVLCIHSVNQTLRCSSICPPPELLSWMVSVCMGKEGMNMGISVSRLPFNGFLRPCCWWVVKVIFFQPCQSVTVVWPCLYFSVPTGIFLDPCTSLPGLHSPMVWWSSSKPLHFQGQLLLQQGLLFVDALLGSFLGDLLHHPLYARTGAGWGKLLLFSLGSSASLYAINRRGGSWMGAWRFNPIVLNLWVTTPNGHRKTQAFTLQFITVAKVIKKQW